MNSFADAKRWSWTPTGPWTKGAFGASGGRVGELQPLPELLVNWGSWTPLGLLGAEGLGGNNGLPVPLLLSGDERGNSVSLLLFLSFLLTWWNPSRLGWACWARRSWKERGVRRAACGGLELWRSVKDRTAEIWRPWKDRVLFSMTSD